MNIAMGEPACRAIHQRSRRNFEYWIGVFLNGWRLLRSTQLRMRSRKAGDEPLRRSGQSPYKNGDKSRVLSMLQ
jgi:hypothetical protein